LFLLPRTREEDRCIIEDDDVIVPLIIVVVMLIIVSRRMMWCYCSLLLLKWLLQERFFWGSPRVKTLLSKFVKICLKISCTWNHSKLRFIHSILHFSNNNNNIHGSINDDECIKNTRRFLKIYPRETSRREVKLWSGLSRYFDRVNEFCCLTRTEKKGDRSFVRSFVIILLHDDACTHQSRCCSWHWHIFFFFFFL